MVKLFTFLFNTFPRMLAWLYLLVAIFDLVVCTIQIKNKVKCSVGQRIFVILNCVYILFFFITRIFFVEIWGTIFPIIGVMVIFIACCWSRYDDKRNGRRWWNW